ncbi:hypothetical protein [Streptomyces sp. NPDC058657]|uniref:hypothetical protein n=1 Tax=unclassified Streptomyces TaxID=2593676 RepID=UPI00364DF430
MTHTANTPHTPHAPSTPNPSHARSTPSTPSTPNPPHAPAAPRTPNPPQARATPLVPPAGLTRFAFVAGPLALLAYGGIRLLSERGTPGLGWTLGHLAMLTGVLLFLPVLRHLHRAAPPSRRRAASVALVAAGAGLVATAAQAVIDLVAGLAAADRPAMREIFRQVKAVPGVEPVVYGVVPPLFFLGLIVLAALVAASARTRILMAGTLLAGTVCMAVSLDLLPLGGLCFLLAFTPLLLAGRVTALPRTN